MSADRSFPMRRADASNSRLPHVRWQRAATLEDVVNELGQLRLDLESRTLAARCRRAWNWCINVATRIRYFIYWN